MKAIRLAFLFAAAALASCSDKDIYSPIDNPSDSIAFTIASNESRSDDEQAMAGFAGRGQLVSEDGKDSLYLTAFTEDWTDDISSMSRANGVAGTFVDDIEDFTVSCLRRNSSGNATDYYFINQPYEKRVSDYVHSEGKTYYWAGTAQEHYDFFVTSLQGATVQDITPSSTTSPNLPTITYTVPTDNANQKDIVTAKYLDAPANWGQVVPLDFQHIMTAIRFKAANDVIPGQITSIELSGIHNSGTFSFSPTLQNPDSWTIGSTTTAYSVTPDVNISSGTSGNHTVTPDDYIGTFVLLPQTLGSDAAITVKFKDAYSNTEFTLTMSLAGYNWPMGQVITYVISTSQIEATPVFTVTSTNATTLTPDGGNVSFDVTSHINLTGNQGTSSNYAVAWTSKLGTYDESTGVFTEASQDDYPWLDISSLSGNGTEMDAQTINVPESYIRGIVASTDTHLQALKNSTIASSSSQSSPYNLATKGGTESESTANCYIVDGPGWYSFPLVYGNAIKNGATNSSAYTFSPTMTNWISPYNESGTEKGGYLSAFKDGNGTTISSPSISGASTAELLWSNEDNVIQNVQISGSNVVFYVPEENITQNNALIAVKNASNTILWSWHIWITDRGKSANNIAVTGNNWYYVTGSTTNTVYTDSEILTNVNYNFMDVPLGYRDECTLTYPARSVWVEFEQTGTGKKVYVQVTQSGKDPETRLAETMYYQFGRKDPFSQYVGTTSYGDTPKNGTNTNLYPYYYNGKDSYKQSLGNAYTYQTYTSGPDIYYYSTSTYPRYWNPWNNSTVITTTTFDSTDSDDDRKVNDNLFNNLNNYFINSPTNVVKTVYDPSPRGYTVMPGQSVSGFTAYGLSTGTQQTGIYSFATTTWNGTSKNVNIDITSEPVTTFGTTLNFHTSPMTSLGTVGTGTTTIGFQNLGTLSGAAATFKNYNGYYWTANKERNITEASGNTSSLADTYQAGCLFTFGKTLKNGTNNAYTYYDITIRTHAAFGVRSCCPVRCTAE